MVLFKRPLVEWLLHLLILSIYTAQTVMDKSGLNLVWVGVALVWFSISMSKPLTKTLWVMGVFYLLLGVAALCYTIWRGAIVH